MRRVAALNFILRDLTVRYAVPAVLLCVLAGCGGSDGASGAVKEFAEAMSDSSYQQAWDLLTPESQHWFDSTAAVLHRFGWTESEGAVTELMGVMSEEEFLAITGRDVFARMVSVSEDVHNLSTSIRSVSYPDSLVGVVVVRTEDGPQEIIVRNIGGAWLIDLTSLMPPVRGG